MAIYEYAPKVIVLQSTPKPEHLVWQACSNSMKGAFASDHKLGSVEGDKKLSQLIRYLYDANHTSPFEHAVITFDVRDISRACADQLRTHRMGSFTMSSTHYQNHAEYDHFVSYDMAEQNSTKATITYAMNSYEQAAFNYGKESARQFLPLSTGARMIWTVNARSLINFLNLRLCYRNTDEMVLLAKEIHAKAREWFLELFTWVGQDCDYGNCKQGNMRCNFSKRHAELIEYKAWRA